MMQSMKPLFNVLFPPLMSEESSRQRCALLKQKS